MTVKPRVSPPSRKNRGIRWSLATLCAAYLATTPIAAHAAVFYPSSFTLANGLQVIVVPNHLAPVVNQMVWYKVGAADETRGKSGLAHYLEHLMFRGTVNVPAGEFSKTIAAQGGEDNAFTAHDYTAFFETVASDRLPMIMQMEADRMQNLRIAPETATPELSVVLNERQERTDNNPEGRFHEKLGHLLMPHSPYGRPVIGWKHEIEALTVNDARQFYETHYAPNNAVVIISGDVVVDDVMRLAAATFGRLPRLTTAPRHTFHAPTEPARERFTMVDAGVEQPQLEWQFVVPSYATQKNHEAYALEVLEEALGGGEVGALYKKLVNDQDIASALETGYDPDARGDTTFTLAVTPHPGKQPEELERALRAALRDLAQKGLTVKAIEDAKQRLQRGAVFARDSLMMPGYAFGMALTTGHKVSDVEAWPDRIKSVTPDDVNAALHDLANSKFKTMGLLLPDAKATPEEREAAHDMIGHERGIR